MIVITEFILNFNITLENISIDLFFIMKFFFSNFFCKKLIKIPVLQPT